MTLRTGADFEKYVARMGRPKFAVNLGEDEADDDGPFVRLSSDEWLFCDDLAEPMRVLLRWDACGLRMQLTPSFENDRTSVGWAVVGISD
ncbi:hypothetical protein [Caballeronia sp.]|uniref:hypothetical protein n=1 Tax=Caballeronia sp. TaxID=1931223 RepID=UPI003C4BC95B